MATTDGAIAHQKKMAHYAGKTHDEAIKMSGADLAQAVLAEQTDTPVGPELDGARYEQLMESPVYELPEA